VIRRLVRPRRGQALVESAISLMVVLMLTVGVVDFARAVWASNTVAYIAREAARYGTIPSRSSTDIQNFVRTQCATVLHTPCPPSPTFTVTVTRGTCGSNTSPVIVTVTYQFEAASLMIANLWGGGTLPLQARSQMYVEQGPAGGCAA
jgi:Flp pilus assembly protein TadG